MLYPQAHRYAKGALERKWARHSASAGAAHPGYVKMFTGGTVPSEEIRALEDAISMSLGARKRNRWQNDRLLRDLAGTLTAADMRGLFNPVPFGERVPSAFERASWPENRLAWEPFRNIDSDKERRVLDALSRAQTSDRSSRRSPLDAWSAVPRAHRAALRRADPGTLCGCCF